MEILHSLILGKGEPLIILHGYLGMGDNWKTLAIKFAENYEVHLVDQRNHGRSFHTYDFNYDFMMEDLAVYLNRHQLKKVFLLGHSMGGKTAMFFSVTFPEMIDKLIVADIAPRYYPPHHELILKALNSVDFSMVNSRNDIELIMKKYISEDGIRQFLMKNVYRKSKNEYAFRFNLESLTDNNDDIGDGLPQFTEYGGETLFLKGENSGYISTEDKNLIKSHFPNSKIVTIPDAGHWMHAENPTEFCRSVVEFLGKY
jgi:esterase